MVTQLFPKATLGHIYMLIQARGKDKWKEGIEGSYLSGWEVGYDGPNIGDMMGAHDGLL
jgi:hypothetical protein